jgi:16S rRNA G966 N2-methylase RsmD
MSRSKSFSETVRRLVAKAHHAAVFITRRGVIPFARELCHRLVNYYHERRLQINTANRIMLASIGIDNPDSREYTPIGYAAFYAALKRVPLDKSKSTLLDYGVGKGRAVCLAATFSFRRIIGVDISKELIETASENLKRMRHRKTRSISLIATDATQFDVPKDVNLIYFFNPFAGDTLEKVIANIHASIKQYPRKVFIIFFNNDHFDKMIRGQSWIIKIYQGQFYPLISCGVYETLTQ